ncbi:MAG: tRNA pseudouridine(38-40) synthase TruA [Planctomycetota bacterium]|jgi:tRNA pseudouridine38-40 synthase|nr:tRNA pseudouridine(38-40) synthase TruA [Planctomycetota bacterium]MDG2141971.1 tRNA pseudouridine(38-40) synthase TruA [Planctomycetota bacterium]
MLRNVRILVSYDGSRFFGWQRQEGFWSVQEAIEEALLGLTGETVTVRGSGRTDAGVHALGQVANFHLDTDLTDNRLWHGLNGHLGRCGAVIRALQTCEGNFHAQRSACGKRYAYVIETARFQSPFTEDRAHFVRGDLNIGPMREAAAHFVGEHDFSCLVTTGSERASNVRRIFGVHLVERRTGIAIVVGGNGFLYNMVRTLAGTLIDVGLRRRRPESIPALLIGRERSAAGETGPAGGLYMISVQYPGGIDWVFRRDRTGEPI